MGTLFFGRFDRQHIHKTKHARKFQEKKCTHIHLHATYLIGVRVQLVVVPCSEILLDRPTFIRYKKQITRSGLTSYKKQSTRSGLTISNHHLSKPTPPKRRSHHNDEVGRWAHVMLNPGASTCREEQYSFLRRVKHFARKSGASKHFAAKAKNFWSWLIYAPGTK